MIVLDTHAWIWWAAAPERLSKPAREAIADSHAIGVSTMSVWELATLARRGRIALDRDIRDWVRRALAEPRVAALVPNADIALAGALLDDESFPGDPADRLIFATARAQDALLVTRDEALRAFDTERTLW